MAIQHARHGADSRPARAGPLPARHAQDNLPSTKRRGSRILMDVHSGRLTLRMNSNISRLGLFDDNRLIAHSWPALS